MGDAGSGGAGQGAGAAPHRLPHQWFVYHLLLADGMHYVGVSDQSEADFTELHSWSAELSQCAWTELHPPLPAQTGRDRAQAFDSEAEATAFLNDYILPEMFARYGDRVRGGRFADAHLTSQQEEAIAQIISQMAHVQPVPAPPAALAPGVSEVVDLTSVASQDTRAHHRVPPCAAPGAGGTATGAGAAAVSAGSRASAPLARAPVPSTGTQLHAVAPASASTGGAPAQAQAQARAGVSPQGSSTGHRQPTAGAQGSASGGSSAGRALGPGSPPLPSSSSTSTSPGRGQGGAGSSPSAGRWAVYHIRCVGGNHYVGKTENLDRRYAEHASGRGSTWTRKNPPLPLPDGLQVLSWHDSDMDASAAEQTETVRLMSEYGIGSVRGGKYVQIKLDDATFKSAVADVGQRTGACTRCGRKGHFVKDCRETQYAGGGDIDGSSTSDSEDTLRCTRCGRDHPTRDCYARSDIYDRQLSPVRPAAGGGGTGTGRREGNQQATRQASLLSALVQAFNAARAVGAARGSQRAGRVRRRQEYEDEEDEDDDEEEDDEEEDDEEEDEDDDEPGVVCYRCGYPGHIRPDCYAVRHIDGRRLG